MSEDIADLTRLVERWHGMRGQAREEIVRTEILMGLELLKIVALVGENNFRRWSEINLPNVEWVLIQQTLTQARAHESVRGKQIKEVIHG